MMIGSASTEHYTKAQQSLHASVHGEPTGPTSNAEYHAPNILIARAYRNWHSPRDLIEFKRRQHVQKNRKAKSMEHTNPMKEWMKEVSFFYRVVVVFCVLFLVSCVLFL